MANISVEEATGHYFVSLDTGRMSANCFFHFWFMVYEHPNRYIIGRISRVLY
ncbi:hypothetical protein [Idiomarina piscisalsi]|uniref:hypothetical protein n=1 Tax=Idiomarina piscisalsi TaxID=1096243 RepID=UPI0012FD0F7A|nr:hypothetical protein [Idiomarina piscisalsi]